MNWFPGMPSVLQSFKVYTCLIPLACLLHKLSRVMGWTKRRDRSITLAGRVHTSPPGIFVGEFFKVPFVPVCDFDPDTFPDQIVGEVPERLMDGIAPAGNASHQIRTNECANLVPVPAELYVVRRPRSTRPCRSPG